MQRSKPGVGLIHPEESGANPALMHHTVEIILQSKKIEAVAAYVIEVIVVHPGTLKLEKNRADDPACLAINNHPLICDVIIQPVFGGQVIGVFVENPEEIFVELANVGSARVLERRIWPLCRQSISDHAPVSGDGLESGSLKSGGDVFVCCSCKVAGDYVTWKIRLTQNLPEVGQVAGKKIEPEEIVFVISQQDAPSRRDSKNL
jgi:hypothetical protein